MADVIKDRFETRGAFWFMDYSFWWEIGSFVAQHTYSTEKLALYGYRHGTNESTYYVDIFLAGTDHKPTGFSLGNFTFVLSDWSTSGEWKIFTISSPISINQDAEYCFIIRPSITDRINYFAFGGDTSVRDEPNYTGGYSMNSGSTWTIILEWAKSFRTYSEEVLVPSAPINPTPADDATGITLDDTLLTWEDGGGAETYDVYFAPYGEFYEKIASDITDTFFDAIVAHTPAFNGHYSYGQKYLWVVIAKNEYGANYDPPEDFGIGYGGTVWEFNAMVFVPPLPTGITLVGGVPTGTATGGNNMITTKRLVAAAQNRIFYESI
jgi:hypothetical protein